LGKDWEKLLKLLLAREMFPQVFRTVIGCKAGGRGVKAAGMAGNRRGARLQSKKKKTYRNEQNRKLNRKT